MVKRCIRFLVVALAFQFLWGTASAYCNHETGKASHHFGHHPHQHQQAESDKNGENSSSRSGVDPDCASCVHSPLGVFDVGTSVIAQAGSRHDVKSCRDVQPAPYLGQPERPQWNLAA